MLRETVEGYGEPKLYRWTTLRLITEAIRPLRTNLHKSRGVREGRVAGRNLESYNQRIIYNGKDL